MVFLHLLQGYVGWLRHDAGSDSVAAMAALAAHAAAARNAAVIAAAVVIAAAASASAAAPAALCLVLLFFLSEMISQLCPAAESLDSHRAMLSRMHQMSLMELQQFSIDHRVWA